jgi:hypothetical protein
MKHYYIQAYVVNPFTDQADWRQVYKTTEYSDINLFMQANWTGFSYRIISNHRVLRYHFE